MDNVGVPAVDVFFELPKLQEMQNVRKRVFGVLLLKCLWATIDYSM